MYVFRPRSEVGSIQGNQDQGAIDVLFEAPIMYMYIYVYIEREREKEIM